MSALDRSFFARDAVSVARELLGMTLVRIDAGGARLSGRIVETEAYREDDTAAHSFRGRTKRNAPMFLNGGHAYVYFIYGMHFCFNVVAETESVGAAVLIRALEPLEGATLMRARRGDQPVHALCCGPANVCKAMGIGRMHSGIDLLNPASEVRIEAGAAIPNNQVISAPRIGISGDARALEAPWRFYLVGSASVSGLRRRVLANPPARG